MKGSNVMIRFLVLITMFLVTIAGCKKEEIRIDPEPDPEESSFQEVIDEGGTIALPSISESVETSENTSSLEVGNELYNCSTTIYDVNAASGGSSGFPLFNPNADIIYPGSMLQGNSLNQANPNPIVVERAGGTISTDILDGNLVSSFTVDEVKKSTITDGINNIISNATGTLPANFEIKITSVQSREQFAVELGVDVNSAFTDIESKLGYSSDVSKSSFLVNLNQSFYTMSFDLPTSLDKLFAPSVTPEQLADYVGPGNPATYISSVTYGRIFYLLIESTSSDTELSIAVDAAFNGGAVDVESTIDIDYFSSLENVTYSIFAYGGEAVPTLEAIGVSDMNSLKDVLKNSTSLESAKPLSYVVRNVSNNQIVATQLATTYEVVECEIAGTTGTLPAIAHWTGHPAWDSFGGVAASFANSNEEFVLLNQSGQYLISSINQNGDGMLEGPFDLPANFPLTSVGAASRTRGHGANIYIFNGQGNKYVVGQLDTGWGPIYDISDYFAGSCPFINTGAGAIAYAGYRELMPFNLTPYGESHFMFNKEGDDCTLAGWEAVLGTNFRATEEVITAFGLNGEIDAVGAAIGYVNSGAATVELVYILFNSTGTEYALWGDFGNGVEVKGPFEL